MTPGEDLHAAWDHRDWLQQAARWPEPFPQHLLRPDDLRAWSDPLARAAAILRAMEISQVDT